MKNRNINFCLLGLGVLMIACQNYPTIPVEKIIAREVLMDKIKGGWAGQAIGCTFGGPTEFRYAGTMINPYINIEWPEHYMKSYYDNSPGLYDDIYMDLTFVDVFEKKGLDAPIEDFAIAFSSADYPLWHANQQARYNIKQGIMPPNCGYWENNPHADDIDFQIEADYAGIMSPGMPNAASYYADEIGHLMNYGDGWYGGVYVANMYAIAYVCDDVEFVVREALKAIPPQSKFYKCMSDVISSYNSYPNNWELTWAMVQKKWSFDIGCPDGVYKAFNIDAVINSAYIIIGLLYGEKDFYKTIDIATRCGQDSDCNPASAAGILGTMIGYSNIPEYWMPNLREVEDRNFAYTDISLNKVYQMSYNQALKVIERNGGTIGKNEVTIKCQIPETVRFEESFAGHWPILVKNIRKPIEEVGELEFNGNGVVVSYNFGRNQGYGMDSGSYVANIEVYLDGALSETVVLPIQHQARKQELYYKYNLPVGAHKISFKCLNPDKTKPIIVSSLLVYSDKPIITEHQ
jgi:hypothetical protein